MTGSLTGRTIVVTGATRGIGRATALRLAGEGAHVVATGRSEADGAETVRLVQAAGGSAEFLRHEVARDADWAQVTAAAEARGGYRGLVNNAGLFFVKPLAETTEADFDAIYAVNVEGTFLGVKHATAAFVRGGQGGAIVNVSSLMGQVGVVDGIAYCATKGAVTGMTKAAAVDGAALEPPVRVNSLHPGVIWTEMITGQFGDSQALADAFAADTPLRSVGSPSTWPTPSTT